MPGMYPPQGPAVFYPMQAGRGQMYYQQPNLAGQVPRRFPQQQGGKGQQFQQGGPQGYMVQGPQGNRQPRQNQRRQGPPQQVPPCVLRTLLVSHSLFCVGPKGWPWS